MHKHTPVLTSIVFILAIASPMLAFQGAAKHAKAVPAAKNASALKNQKEKLSYAIGVSLGHDLRRQAIEVDLDLVMRGLKDAASGGKMLLTEQELQATLVGLKSEHKAKATLAAKELGEKNEKAGEAFLAENKSKEGVVTLESGLQYKILKAGEGNKPKSDDSVVCHYRGTLLDGTEVDSSYKRNQPATFAVNRVIKGWSQALQLMPVDSKWQLFIPSSLAYGERRAGRVIGPNATLIFEVELISIKDTSSAEARASQKQDATRPDVGTKQEVAGNSAGAAPAALSDIKIAFKDPRLSDPTYGGGERWISTPTFTSAAQGGTEATVEARAVGIGTNGTQRDASAEWTPADPKMVTVTPSQKNQVKITVHRAGESKLTVASKGVSKELLIKAKSVGNNAIQVEIAQKQ